MSSTIKAPRRATRRPSPLVLAAAVGLALAVSGCAAGQISQTAQEVAAIDGGNATVGQIGVRNVLFEAPAAANYGPGSTVPVSLVISNNGTSQDTLTAVSTPIGASVAIRNSKISLPAQHNVTVGSTGTNAISVKGLTASLCFGTSVPVTFTFAEAGTVTVNVPIANPVQRTGTRETINIQPPEPTPVWLTGAEGYGAESGAQSGAGTGSSAQESTSAAASSAPGIAASAGPASSCNR